MPADPRSSVAALVPVWNGAAFLAQALESILAQVPAVDEVLVVDDGSSDESAALAESFGPRVRCLRRPHRGLAATRNEAVRSSRSDLIAFLDSDDLWPPGRLSLLLRALEENPDCGIAQGRLQRLVRSAAPPGWELVNESWRAPNLSTALIRRSAFATVGPFDEGLSPGDDVDWLLRARELGVREARVDSITLHYRRHEANLTNDVAMDRSSLLRVLGRSIARRRAGAPEEPPDGSVVRRS
jgi:glycosyltransferase involved in cell wall biosynthesis